MNELQRAPNGTTAMVEPPVAAEDFLGHEALAGRLVENIQSMTAGSVMAVQGSWGRGKTDILGRMRRIVSQGRFGGFAGIPPVWLNPWKYGSPDLLTPLVVELSALIRGIKHPLIEGDKRTTRRLLAAIMHAGLSFGLKAASLSLPLGGLLGTLYEESSTFVEQLPEMWRDEKAADELEPDPDPVAVMGDRFAELVSQILNMIPAEGTTEKRLWIFVDDLDRCLPHRQVSLLEAIHFLVSSRPRANFVVALDPVLARQALTMHHGSKEFDSDKYLAKLFDIRVTLPSVSDERLTDLVRPICSKIASDRQGIVMRQMPALLRSAEIRNPRVIVRVAQKLDLLTRSIEISGYNDRKFLLLIWWLCLAERWPQVRLAFQESPANSISRIIRWVRGGPGAEDRASVSRLPTRAEDPELAECLEAAIPLGEDGGIEGVSRAIVMIEILLQDHGL